MGWPYFVWKGINSLNKNIGVEKLPDIERPEANIKKIEIEGRSGYLTEDSSDTYKSIIKTCECYLKNGSVEEISAWLTGLSEVVFSNEPDRKYKATIINKIPFTKIVPAVKKFIVIFDCQPFKYQVSQGIIALTEPGVIINQGTVESRPILKIYGTGDISVTVNGNTFSVIGLTDYVTVDSDLMDCYRDTELWNNKMTGDFPVFFVGQNSISWTGNITKIEITPNWCWL
jgi:phage-related protein